MNRTLSIILTGFSAAVVGILAFFSAITVTFIPGVAAIYPATAVEAAVGAWFGLPGAIGSYLGLLFAGVAGGWFSPLIGGVLSLSDFLLAAAPAIAVRFFKLDPALPNLRHAVAYVLTALVFGSLPGSLLYNYINLQIGILPDIHSFWVAVIGWNVGNALVISFIGVPLARLATPAVRKLGLFRATSRWV